MMCDPGAKINGKASGKRFQNSFTIIIIGEDQRSRSFLRSLR